jgi:glutamyl-tRNA reductase
MRVGVIGINHKLAELKLREIIARVCQKRFGAGHSLHGEHAFILLSTCNRTELYFSSFDLVQTHSYILTVLNQEIAEEFDQKLYSYFGQECFAHLVTVAAGFDSAIVAETEIQGQVKHAYEASLGYCSIPAPLHYLFQKALKISKSIRSKYSLGRGMPDLEHAIYQTGCHLFKKPQDKAILFIGASDINRKILDHLRYKGCRQMALCNRSTAHGEALSERFQIPHLPWSMLDRWEVFDWIILGTKAPDYLITREISTCFTSQKLIMDLSCPRNVDPLLAKDPRILLLNIDQINRMLKCRRRRLYHTLKQAQGEINNAVQLHAQLFHAKQERCVA